MAVKNTYEDLLRDIQSSGQNWSEADLNLAKENLDAGRSIYSQKTAWSTAKTDEERLAANQAAEMIRQKYGGYSGGKDGGSYTLSDKYAPPVTSYASKYAPQIESLFSQLQNREEFNYNPAADPSYQAYSEKYRNLGRTSAANALGSAAAMTGGQLNSYALTASQQAQDSYNAQMSDRIPELQKLAYDMYLGDLNEKRNDLSTLMQMDQVDYGRSRDAYSDTVTNWQLNQGVDQQALENQRYDDQTAYDREQTELTWAYQKDSDAYDRALQRWQITGTLDAEGAAVLGVPAGTRTSDYQYQLAQMAKLASSGSGGGSDGGSKEQDYEGLYAAAQQSANPANFIASNYKKYGFSKVTGLSDGYKTWVSEQDVSNKVTNQAGDSWIQVTGFGRLSWDELERKVSSGQITETLDQKTGKYTYKKS